MTLRGWSGVVLREGEWTNDGRFIEIGATTWNEPLPVLAIGDRVPAETVGTIDRVWRDGNDVWAAGTGPDGEWWPTADMDCRAFVHEERGLRMGQVELRAVVAGRQDKRVWDHMPMAQAKASR